jgi:hypothetical protein
VARIPQTDEALPAVADRVDNLLSVVSDAQ